MDARRISLAAAALLAAVGTFPTGAVGPAPTPEERERLALERPKRFPKVSAVGEDDLTCLALNVYWEARGEPEDGRRAVAHVTLNRVGAPGFPGTVCGVVRQGGRDGPCQFHWFCDDTPDTPIESQAWLDAQMVAYKTMVESRDDPTAGALYFHNVDLRPAWAAARLSTRVIGRHVFFRLKGGDLGDKELAALDP